MAWFKNLNKQSLGHNNYWSIIDLFTLMGVSRVLFSFLKKKKTVFYYYLLYSVTFLE